MKIKDLLERGQPLPDNPYAHQVFLIKNPKKQVEDFGDLVHEHLMLGNFGKDRILALYQEEADALVTLFSLARKFPRVFGNMFRRSFWSFIIRVDLTRAHKGLERLIQAGPLKLPEVPEATGFGGLMEKVTGKKKSPEDILMEQMLYGSGGMYE